MLIAQLGTAVCPGRQKKQKIQHGKRKVGSTHIFSLLGLLFQSIWGLDPKTGMKSISEN